MVQGGCDVAIAAGDSAGRHFPDTPDGGKWLNDDNLAWTLVVGARRGTRMTGTIIEEGLRGAGGYPLGGDSMGAWVPKHGAFAKADATALDEATAFIHAPFARPARDLSPIRDALLDLMWGKAGILRDGAIVPDWRPVPSRA